MHCALGEDCHLDGDIGHPVEGAGADFVDEFGCILEDGIIEFFGAILIFMEDFEEEVTNLGGSLLGLAGIDEDSLEFVIHSGVLESLAHSGLPPA